MIEVLYHSISNELLLFSYKFKFDAKKNTIIFYLETKRNHIKIVDVNELVHIGWL